MKRVLLLTVAVGLLLFAPSAFAQFVGPITMTYDGSRNYDGGTWQGGGTLGTETVITGFYGGTINGVSVGGSASNPGMLCDDYTTNLQTPWSANAINATTLLQNWSTDGSSTKFGTNLSAIGENGYIAMAIIVEAAFSGNLAIDALANANGAPYVSSATAADVSEALWCITGGPGNCSVSKGMSQAAYNLWQNAVAEVGGSWGSVSLSTFANLWLYVPTPQNGSQEMWSNVAVAEGGTAFLYLLLAGLSCLGAIFFRRSNRSANTELA